MIHLTVEKNTLTRLQNLRPSLSALNTQLKQSIERNDTQFPLRHDEMATLSTMLNLVETVSGAEPQKGISMRDLVFIVIGMVLVVVMLLMYPG